MKCHRYASANSFSKNIFKITGRLDWVRKNNFMAGNICSNHSTAENNDSYLVLLYDKTVIYISEFTVTLETNYCELLNYQNFCDELCSA
jgi:hypothetical protein